MLHDKYALDYSEFRANGFVANNGDKLFPFTSLRKRMSCLQLPASTTTSPRGRRSATTDMKATLFVKGAAETVLDLCTHITVGGNANSTAETNSVLRTSCSEGRYIYIFLNHNIILINVPYMFNIFIVFYH
jgi:hypothetical protein